MKNKFKWILAILIIVVMAIIIANCDLGTVDDGGNDESGTSIESGTSNENKNDLFSIDAIERTNDKWKMTYKECQVKDKLDLLTTAEDGTEFVIVFFEIENISEESQNFSVLWEEFYIDGVKTTQTLYGMLIDNSFQLTAVPVEPGRKAKGYFLFQISPDWKELEIIYDESLTDENEENVIKFVITKGSD